MLVEVGVAAGFGALMVVVWRLLSPWVSHAVATSAARPSRQAEIPAPISRRLDAFGDRIDRLERKVIKELAQQGSRTQSRFDRLAAEVDNVRAAARAIDAVRAAETQSLRDDVEELVGAARTLAGAVDHIEGEVQKRLHSLIEVQHRLGARLDELESSTGSAHGSDVEDDSDLEGRIDALLASMASGPTVDKGMRRRRELEEY